MALENIAMTKPLLAHVSVLKLAKINTRGPHLERVDGSSRLQRREVPKTPAAPKPRPVLCERRFGRACVGRWVGAAVGVCVLFFVFAGVSGPLFKKRVVFQKGLCTSMRVGTYLSYYGLLLAALKRQPNKKVAKRAFTDPGKGVPQIVLTSWSNGDGAFKLGVCRRFLVVFFKGKRKPPQEGN